MTAKVISVAGVPVEVATPGGAGDVPIANATTAGIVKGGGNVQIAADGTLFVQNAVGTKAGVVSIGTGIAIANGEISMDTATLQNIGGFKKAMPVADVQVVPVTDIASDQEAIAAMGTTLHELMQVLRNAGHMEG